MRNNPAPKVLLGCPINIVKNYCLDSWLKMVVNLTYSNYDIYLVDNSRNPEYHKKLSDKYKVKIDYVDPAKMEAREYMAKSIEKIRQRAVKRKYDYLFILECDIFPHPQIIELLMGNNKPVVGTSFWTGFGDKTFFQLLGVEQIEERKVAPFFLGLSQIRVLYNGQLQTSFANGNGCVLIKREVLEKIKFRVDMTQEGFSDGFFHIDLFMLGIENWIDTSIIPLHWNSRWNTVPDNKKHALMFDHKKSKTL